MNNQRARERMSDTFSISVSVRSIAKSAVCLLLLSSMAIFQSCSKDDDNGSGPLTEHSVEVTQSPSMPSDGVIASQYSDSPAGSDISKIVDDNKATSFATPYAYFYIRWTGAKSTSVSSYTLTSSNVPAENDPRAWVLSASRDGQNWVPLDTQSGQVFSDRQSTKEYRFINTTRYKYYRLQILSNNGGSLTHIAEWTMKAPDISTDISDLISAYGMYNTYSAATPMGTNFLNKPKTTQDIRDWLLDAANEPKIPVDLNSSFSLVAHDVNLFPYGDPCPGDCNQDAVGNCGVVAALAGMAYKNPAFVKSLITDNGNKTYTVSMYDPEGQPVQVKVSNKFVTKSNMTLGAVSSKNDQAAWSTVLEKAVMKYNEKYLIGVKSSGPDIGGYSHENTIPLFTGDGASIAFKRNVLTPEELSRVVYASLMQGKFVFGGFNPAGKQVDGGTTVGSHVFTCMHTSSDVALFSMRNPWGGDQSYLNTKKDGVLNIPDDKEITDTIDLRIVDPGAAGDSPTDYPYPILD